MRRRRSETISSARSYDTGVPVASPPFAALAGEAALLGLALSSEQIALCEKFAHELIERNTSVNLTAITEPQDIARKHFLDSFTAFAVRRWTGRERVIDVGSGAGFPGLALRIALPKIRVTLVESVGKKARFLEDICALLGLTDVEVRNERAEALGRDRRDRYDVGTARAVGTLGMVNEYLLPFLRVGGDAIVWKGRVDAELAGAQKACAALGGEIASIVPTASLGVGEVLPGRSLVVVRKMRATPLRYPRASAEARRRPW
jgi:16S rRNA (guanine527-N7)-methyltransferase